MRDVVRAVMGTDTYHHMPMAAHMSRCMHIIAAGSCTNTHKGRMRAHTRDPCALAQPCSSPALPHPSTTEPPWIWVSAHGASITAYAIYDGCIGRITVDQRHRHHTYNRHAGHGWYMELGPRGAYGGLGVRRGHAPTICVRECCEQHSQHKWRAARGWRWWRWWKRKRHPRT